MVPWYRSEEYSIEIREIAACGLILSVGPWCLVVHVGMTKDAGSMSIAEDGTVFRSVRMVDTAIGKPQPPGRPALQGRLNSRGAYSVFEAVFSHAHL